MFHALEPTAPRRLLQDAFARNYERGAVLFFQGDAAERFYVVLDGCVRHTPEGGEITLAVFTRARAWPRPPSWTCTIFPSRGKSWWRAGSSS